MQDRKELLCPNHYNKIYSIITTNPMIMEAILTHKGIFLDTME